MEFKISGWTILAFVALFLFGYWYGTTYVAAPAKVYDGYFKTVGKPSEWDSRWLGMDFSEINNVVFSDDEQTSAGNATYEVENGTTIRHENLLAHVYIEIDGGWVRDVELEYNADDSGNFTSDNTILTEAALYDYDTGAKLYEATIDKDGEFTLTIPELDEGEYVLKLEWYVTEATVPSTEGTTDTVGTLDGKLRTEETDEPDRFTDFTFYIKSI